MTLFFDSPKLTYANTLRRYGNRSEKMPPCTMQRSGGHDPDVLQRPDWPRHACCRGRNRRIAAAVEAVCWMMAMVEMTGNPP